MQATRDVTLFHLQELKIIFYTTFRVKITDLVILPFWLNTARQLQFFHSIPAILDIKSKNKWILLSQFSPEG